MKSATVHRNETKTRPNIPYPNAATKKELLCKFLDLVIMAVTGAALAAAALFLMVIA